MYAHAMTGESEFESRISALEGRRGVESRVESLEYYVGDLEDRLENLSKGLGLAFLLISALCFTIIAGKSDG